MRVCRRQSDNFSPHNLVEKILTDRAVIAHRTAKVAPGVGAQASV
jgi:hypothetical protein